MAALGQHTLGLFDDDTAVRGDLQLCGEQLGLVQAALGRDAEDTDGNGHRPR